MRFIVTGAALGIGLATSELLRREGHQVAGVDLRAGVGVYQADVRDQEQVDKAVAEAVRDMGGLDVLINCAGIGEPVDAGKPPSEHAIAMMQTNYFGAWRVTASALPALIEARGRVVNVASGLAFVNAPFASAYIGSKRALASYSDVLRLEYGDRISVTTVYPGYVDTAIHDSSKRAGILLGDLVPNESIDKVARVIVKAALGTPRRDVAISMPTRLGIFVGRHAPFLLDRLVLGWMKGRNVPIRSDMVAGSVTREGPMFKFTGIMIGSDDPKVLSDFYSKVIGPPTWDDGTYVGWAFGDAGVMISEHSEVKGRNEMPGRFLWNLETADVKEEFERIKGLGAAVVREPYQPGGEESDFWIATFEDPDGNYFQIASPMPEM